MFANISWPQLLILLVLVVLIFGTGKLKGLGKDIGGAIKGFKKAMNDEDTSKEQTKDDDQPAEKLEKSSTESSEQKTDSKEKTGS